MKALRFKLSAISAIIIFILTAYCLQLTASAETLSSNDLIGRAKELDSKIVTYKGEIVTDILERGEHSWLNLNDGYNAVGVWCKTPDLKSLKFVGDYKNKGDILEVEGIFNRACPIHGGELDIHATHIKLVQSGFSKAENINRKRVDISVALFLITLSILIVFRKRM